MNLIPSGPSRYSSSPSANAARTSAAFDATSAAVPATRDRRDAIALDAAEEDGGADDALATTARRFETRAGAATRAGDALECERELAQLTRTLATFDATEGEYLDLVALGLEKQLREEERETVRGMVPSDVGEATAAAVARALGLPRR
mmetsp:Transcript_9981/g.36266  ORF Transcript_9981/g.36266 Transcript_9981/m.36266 type:complete len:148 (-) Transcript_9981:49-492(-)